MCQLCDEPGMSHNPRRHVNLGFLHEVRQEVRSFPGFWMSVYFSGSFRFEMLRLSTPDSGGLNYSYPVYIMIITNPVYNNS